MTKRITVFGGSSPKPGQRAYEEAEQLGRLLAKAGYTVITGGYMGTMEAVSKGANEAGGHVIGITCAALEVWRPMPANPWVLEEIKYPVLRQRLYALIDGCDAAFALPGGIGTLAEIALMWSELQTSTNGHARPLILVGGGWERIFREVLETMENYIDPRYHHLLKFAVDVEDGVSMLNKVLAG